VLNDRYLRKTFFKINVEENTDSIYDVKDIAGLYFFKCICRLHICMTNYLEVPGHVLYVPAHIYRKHTSVSQIRIQSQNPHLQMHLALLHVVRLLRQRDHRYS